MDRLCSIFGAKEIDDQIELWCIRIRFNDMITDYTEGIQGNEEMIDPLTESINNSS